MSGKNLSKENGIDVTQHMHEMDNDHDACGSGCGHDHSGHAPQVEQYVRSGDKVGRNDPCPCGSGKKYKKCCSI